MSTLPSRVCVTIVSVALMLSGFYLVACEAFPPRDQDAIARSLIKSGDLVGAALVTTGHPLAVCAGAALLSLGHFGNAMLLGRGAGDRRLERRPRPRAHRSPSMRVNPPKTATNS